MRLLLPLLLLLAACAVSNPVLQDARKDVLNGRGEEALAKLDKAARENPDQREYRVEYLRTRDFLASQMITQAEMLRSSDRLEAAAALYLKVQKYDPDNARARAGLAQLEIDARHRGVVAEAQKLVKDEKYLEAQDLLRPVLNENPQQREARRIQRVIDEKTTKPAIVTPRLKSNNTQPISLELRDVQLRSVFDVISRNSGVSFVLDKDVRADQRTTIVLRNAALEDLIRLVLQTNQLEQKLINETTVLVFPNTPQKLREYQELVVKSFYLANADVKQTANMIRTLVKTRDIFIDEKLNLLVLKDTPNAIRLAERLIAAQDLAEPEVMLEVEVMEVGSTRLMELGLRWPTTFAWSVQGAAGTPGVVTLPEWLNRGSELVTLSFTDPMFLLTLRQEDGTTSVLANPRIRVRNKEKARVHIGDRVPVITTTAAATGGFVSESVSYLDVGLKLEVEPLIYLEDEVGIKVGLEVSNITREVRSLSSSTLTYQIGTRNAATVLRLRDGETQVLAGLISDEDRRSAQRVPGVGELPVVGRLFSATRDNLAKSEIVLLITPRLVRTINRPEARLVEFAAGTEAATGAPAGSIPAPFVPPQIPKPAAAQPVIPQSGTPQFESQPTPLTPPPAAPSMVPFGGVKPPPPE
ncbi:MAG TPA: secretin N-terminal domain-containing protein [Burkholderiales bacterium]